MKRSISPEPFSSEKSTKLVHHSPDDGGAEVSSHHLPVTSTDEHLSCLPRDPVPVTAARDRTQEYLEDAWDLLKPAINIILDDSFSFKSYGGFCCNTIFRAVTRACFGDRRQVQLLIFDLVKQECEPHVAATMLFLEKQGNDPSVFLPLVYNCWLGFKKKMMFVSDLAMYQKNGRTLWDVGQELFHKKLSMAPQLQDKVFAGILGLITDERLGKTGCNTTLLKNLMDMFSGLSTPNVYAKTFLDSTSKFYAEEAERVLQSDISEYLKYVEGSLPAEEEQYYFFFASCRIRLMKVLEQQLLANHMCVFEEGFKVLMDDRRMDDLTRMYHLFSRADMVVYIDRALRSYILAKGDEARQEGSLHELHTRTHKIWDKCFNENGLLDKTIRYCFDGLGLHVRRVNIRIKSSGKTFFYKQTG